MAQASELTAAGLAAETARLLGNTTPLTALTATGSTQADAYQLTVGAFAEFGTVDSGTGAVLASATGSPVTAVSNGGSNALKVYAHSGEYMNGTLNGYLSVTNGKTAIFVPSGTRWIGTLSA